MARPQSRGAAGRSYDATLVTNKPKRGFSVARGSSATVALRFILYTLYFTPYALRLTLQAARPDFMFYDTA